MGDASDWRRRGARCASYVPPPLLLLLLLLLGCCALARCADDARHGDARSSRGRLLPGASQRDAAAERVASLAAAVLEQNDTHAALQKRRPRACHGWGKACPAALVEHLVEQETWDVVLTRVDKTGTVSFKTGVEQNEWAPATSYAGPYAHLKLARLGGDDIAGYAHSLDEIMDVRNSSLAELTKVFRHLDKMPTHKHHLCKYSVARAAAKGLMPPLCVYPFHERYFGDALGKEARKRVAFVTVLREPKQRVQSQYRNSEILRYYSEAAAIAAVARGKVPSLEACVRVPNATCAGNRQAWYLTGQSDMPKVTSAANASGKLPMQPVLLAAPCTYSARHCRHEREQREDLRTIAAAQHEAAALALERMQQYALVGVMERYLEFIELLSFVLQQPLNPYYFQSTHKTSLHARSLSPAEDKALSETNRADAELYDAAKERFAELWALYTQPRNMSGVAHIEEAAAVNDTQAHRTFGTSQRNKPIPGSCRDWWHACMGRRLARRFVKGPSLPGDPEWSDATLCSKNQGSRRPCKGGTRLETRAREAAKRGKTVPTSQYDHLGLPLPFALPPRKKGFWERSFGWLVGR